MTTKPSVEGAPQEEVAKKPVKKTRTTRKSTTTKPKRTNPRRKKVEEPVAEVENVTTEVIQEETTTPTEDKVNTDTQSVPEVPADSAKPEATEIPEATVITEVPVTQDVQDTPSKPEKQATPQEKPSPKAKPEPKPIPPLPNLIINDVVELANAPRNQICLSDQQIQQLTMEEALYRFQYLEYTLANVLNYDVVLSDTNIWLELLVGHTSSHSDPRVNARLQFERQLEFISRLMKHRGGRFTIMAETYEEIDRFATMQEPTNYRDADWSDEALCRNVAARLAKRLILSQQRENRLRIEGICAESHHGAFADPVIIRRTVEMFAKGKKVLLLTNDASVAIRSMGMCDDLQIHNNIDDETWDRDYAPLRPMVMTMDDLKILDLYTRQYHFLQMAAGKQWLEDIPKHQARETTVPELKLWMDAFRPGDRHERHSDIQARQKEQQRQKDLERQRQAEKQKEAEMRKQKEAELQRQKEAQREAQRQKDLERQRQKDQERQRQAELQKQKELEAQKQREAEVQKQKELELQKQREQELQQNTAENQPQQEVPATEQVQPVETAETTEATETKQENKKPARRRPSSRGKSPRSKKPAKQTE